MDHLCSFCLVLLCFHARLFVDAFWSPAGKGFTSWLSFVMSNCDVVTFQLVYWVRCGLIVSIPDLCPLSYFAFTIKVLTIVNAMQMEGIGCCGPLKATAQLNI